MRLRQRHRHVDVMAAGVERGCEYRRIEPRIARVEHDVDAFVRARAPEMAAVFDASSACATNLASAHRSTAAAGAGHIDVGDHDVLEHFGFRSAARDRGPDPTGSDHENADALTLRSRRRARVIDVGDRRCAGGGYRSTDAHDRGPEAPQRDEAADGHPHQHGHRDEIQQSEQRRGRDSCTASSAPHAATT